MTVLGKVVYTPCVLWTQLSLPALWVLGLCPEGSKYDCEHPGFGEGILEFNCPQSSEVPDVDKPLKPGKGDHSMSHTSRSQASGSHVSPSPVSFCQFYRTPRQLGAFLLLRWPPPPPTSPKSSSVFSLAHYMHKLHQKAFVYTLFIHFQRVKQPIYWAVNKPVWFCVVRSLVSPGLFLLLSCNIHDNCVALFSGLCGAQSEGPL